MALPFFGLIFLGYAAAKLKPMSSDGLAWMNFFVIYIALPALFFNLLSQTPVEKLASWGFIFASLLGTYCAFAIAFCVGVFSTDGDIPESTIQGLAGAYGNIGYMGPGLAIAALGPEAAVPVALIFCFDNTMHFAMAPLLMAVGGTGARQSRKDAILEVLKRIFSPPLHHCHHHRCCRSNIAGSTARSGRTITAISEQRRCAMRTVCYGHYSGAGTIREYAKSTGRPGADQIVRTSRSGLSVAELGRRL